jgi:hypothetical protein
LGLRCNQNDLKACVQEEHLMGVQLQAQELQKCP